MLPQELRSGLRALRRTPGTTAAALLSLGLGIGVSCAVFSVVEALLLKPLPFAAQESLVFATETAGADATPNAVSQPDLDDWRARARSFEQLAGFRRSALTLTGLGDAERLDVAAVESGVFAALRARPLLGRLFGAADDLPGAARVVVVSHRFWVQRLGRDPGAPGRSLTLEGQPATVVGVMPESFRFPLDGGAVELWAQPRAVPFGERLHQRAIFFYQVLGRLKPGVAVEQARAELAGITAAIAAANPESHPQRGVLVVPLREQLVGGDRGALLLLLGAVGLLLLIACANVGSLLLARALARRHELAVRAALGATRGDLLRQLLIEAALLGLAGGALGVLGCAVSLEAAAALLPPEIPRVGPIALDAGVFAFALGVSLLCAAVLGTAPALLLSGTGALESLRSSAGSSPGGRRARAALVVAEVALALSLLVSATLLGRSLLAVQRTDPGFRPEGLRAVDLTLPAARYPEQAQPRFGRALVERAAAIPGVTGAALASPLPVGGRALGLTVTPRDRVEPHPPQSSFASLGPGALQLLGVPLERGREFEERDREGAPPVVVVSQALAKELWPGEDPIGKRIGLGPGDTESREVIGLAGDLRQGLEAPVVPALYAPYAQVPWPFATLLVCSQLPAPALHQLLRREVAAIDPELPVAAPRALDEVLAGGLARRRMLALVLGLFASAALALAAVGIYGTLATAVAQRSRELAIRLAIGARPRQVLRQVLLQGLLLAGAGVGLGVLIALALSRALGSLLFGLTTTDPATYAGVSGLLLLVAAAAAGLPALRATRVDPAEALRAE